MDVQTYLSGYVAEKQKCFEPLVQVEHFSVQALGFILMENDNDDLPIQPDYITDIKVFPRIGVKI